LSISLLKEYYYAYTEINLRASGSAREEDGDGSTRLGMHQIEFSTIQPEQDSGRAGQLNVLSGWNRNIPDTRY